MTPGDSWCNSYPPRWGGCACGPAVGLSARGFVREQELAPYSSTAQQKHPRGPDSFPAPRRRRRRPFQEMLILAACSMAFAAPARSQNARGPIRARFRRLEGHIRSRGMAVTDGGELVTADNGGDNILAFHAIAAIPIRKASTNSKGHHAVV